MKIKLSVNYYTLPGQKLYVFGAANEIGNWDEDKAIEMNYLSPSEWSIDLDIYTTSELEYHFFVKEGDAISKREWGKPHILLLSSHKLIVAKNRWHDELPQKYFQTSGFTNSFAFHKSDKHIIYNNKTILLQVLCPFVERSHVVVLCGSTHALGNWQADKSLRLQHVGNNIWQVAIDSLHLEPYQEYKFAIYDTTRNKVVHWEEGENRILTPIESDTIFAQELQYRQSWIDWKAAGMAIPVFSLRTENSFGIGEFSDLKKLVDWAALMGQRVIQLLPINDTTISYTWLDSYPYNAISIYALHPILLGLKEYSLADKAMFEHFVNKGLELNKLESVDYEKVLALKWEYIKLLFDEMHHELSQSKDYTDFLNKNEEWLFPYACFSFLRDRNKTVDTSHWGEYRHYDRDYLGQMVDADKAAKEYVCLMYFVQYLLHKQLVQVKEYAHQNGIILKGDIPIGISRGSVEAWIEPHLFNMNVQTGAPPDDFSVNGQNWGFPTYNWGEMAKDGYQWWAKRFGKMSDYFDAYRIDHILGFFRIWEIPTSSVQGLLGYFSPALPLSVDEINWSGLHFDQQRMTQPFVHENFLGDIFGDYTQEVKEKYLYWRDYQLYSLNDFCNTQAAIKNIFGGMLDPKSMFIRDGLFSLCNEVLFVSDSNQPHKFHPRIAAQHSYSFNFLSEEDKAAFNRLYEDFFYHRHSQFWRNEAMKKLPTLISSTPMLVCGEDLGMIPECVPSVMNELEILSLEIERMPKGFNLQFADLPHLPYLSVCSTSTHDMSPIRSWWHEDKDKTQYYFNEVLNREGTAPQHCTIDICQQIISNQLASPSMLTILPIQDWLSMDNLLRREAHDDERINIPSVPQHYWRYRLHITLEKLIEAADYNKKTRLMIEQAGR